ncbi:MAG: hypothetical protein NTZ87_02235 [Candidatus Nomurabacteria bacterium]|nr:hypothetical protein [Candidatus Nomurabacteria bacterium]
MSKKILQDIKVKHVRSVVRTQSEVVRAKEPRDQNIKRKSSRYTLWFVAIVSVTFLFFAFSNLFLRAAVTINPKTSDVVLNENLSANKDSSADGLSFDIVSIAGEESRTIKANSQKDVSEKATGVVLIYNAYSVSPQPLAIDTRLLGSNGKIYKTLTKTTVPGIDKKGIPGSVEVKIYASVSGVEYNSAPLDFSVLGFKGTSKYLKIYARSKGEITGGFVGKAPAVSDAEKATAISGLKISLQAKLLTQAIAQTPNGFILFKNAIFFNTDDSNISSTYNSDGSMTMTLKGSLDGILFNEQKLTKKITEDNIDKYDGSDVYIPNIHALIFSMSTSGVLLKDAPNINFNLSGSAKIVWKLDESKLITDLLGKSKKDFSQILLQYPNIDSADLTISPFWKTSLPDKSKNIKVIINYPN